MNTFRMSETFIHIAIRFINFGFLLQNVSVELFDSPNLISYLRFCF